MTSDSDRRTKTLERRYKGNRDQKALNEPLLFTAGQFVYNDQPPLTTSATERLSTKSYNNLMPCETGRFKIGEVSPSTLTTN